MSDEIGLPKSFDSHMFTFVKRDGSTILFLGHAPFKVIDQALQLAGTVDKLLIQQEEMHSDPKTYRLWTFEGDVKEVATTTPVNEALRNQGVIKSSAPAPARETSGLLLPTVLTAGLADGVNPCAFAVMAFFTALLFALRRSRQNILMMGAIYIVTMYITYFLLGLGLLRALNIFDQPHVFIEGGAVLVIALGAIQFKDLVFPQLPLHLTIPKPAWERIQNTARRATVPSAIVLGFLVGLCTLPCSGGIYVAILTLLNSQTSYVSGLGYLSLYNVMFVLPLVGILLVISSRPMSLALAGWERSHTRTMHGAVSLAMIALGIFILGFLH